MKNKINKNILKIIVIQVLHSMKTILQLQLDMKNSNMDAVIVHIYEL